MRFFRESKIKNLFKAFKKTVAVVLSVVIMFGTMGTTFGSQVKDGQLLFSNISRLKQIIPQSQLYSTGVSTLMPVPKPTLNPKPKPIVTPKSGNGTGLLGLYYDNADFTNLKIRRVDKVANFNWGNGSPDASMGADYFSVRWSGQVEPKFSKIYTFYTKTDDGVRLWVNNKLLIDKWRIQGATEWKGTIYLTAGQKYNIKMEYYEKTGRAVAQLLWSSAGQPKEIIPRSQLYPAPMSTPALTAKPKPTPTPIGTPIDNPTPTPMATLTPISTPIDNPKPTPIATLTPIPTQTDNLKPTVASTLTPTPTPTPTSTPIATPTNGSGSEDTRWIIPLANRVGQKLPMRILHPRPDTETSSLAAHRNAHSKIIYKTPISIQGGERPFKYEIISAPAGTTIVSEMQRSVDPLTGKTLHTRQDDLGVVTWTPAAGTHKFSIKVTDQSSATVTVDWSVTLNDSNFVIIDSSVNRSGDGTWASPLKTWADLWGTDKDATYANKIAYFKNGTYQVANSASANVSVNLNVKPLAYMGESKEGTVFDTSRGHFYVNRGDVTFSNLSFTGSRKDANNRIIQVSTKNSNYLFFNLSFDNETVGTLANDNPGCIVFMDDTTYTKNVSLINCSTGTACALCLLVTFTVDGVLVENCYIRTIPSGVLGGNAGNGIHIKDDTKNCTLAFNKVEGIFPGYHIGLSNQQGTLAGSANQEVCYNIIIDKATTNRYEGSPLIWNQACIVYPNPVGTYCYRNSVITIKRAHVFRTWIAEGSTPVQVTGEAWTGLDFSAGLGYKETGVSSVKLTSADFDNNGLFTNINNARTTYLGKVGAEISD
ncbi:MAG: PA14 domain-containing protein [Clostridia bacterium]|nr:PA14 domain-containing protein [Clostridia bacterium]